jgi:Ser/Thr protein kinase RdoA (MazF antagonist)
VYRLDAGGRRYAVKEMRNPWAEPRWQEWLAESWSFEQRAIAAGVAAPQPVPNPADGSCLAWVRRLRQNSQITDAPVRVHHWTAGAPAGTGPVHAETARWAGRVLATLHGLRITPQDRSLFPVTSTATADRWSQLTEAVRRSQAPWADAMEGAAPGVALIADLARAAGFRPDQEVMKHGDIDQKNLLLTASGPVLCESMMIGLDWVAFNVERAVGLRPVAAPEASLARDLVPGLLAAIPAQAAAATRVRDLDAPTGPG